MRGGKGWWPWWVAVAVAAGMLVLVGVTFAPLGGKDGLQNAANRAQLTGGLLIAAAIPTIAVAGWARRRSRELRAAAGPTVDTLIRAKDLLAGLVAEQWQNEARMRSLDDPDPIPVRWRTPAPNSRAAAVRDHPANIEPGGVPAMDQGWTVSSADIDALADRFRRTRRRRLVILGGPGTGKTTLAMQLLLHLLATRTPDEPIPVLLPAADWDTDQHARLQDWVTERLLRDYPALRAPGLGVDVGRALAARGHILPVLDGLDELPSAAQTKTVSALNHSLGGEDQLILTSRTTEFINAVTTTGDVITSAAVLQPLLLAPAAAADYLTRCLPPDPGPRWRGILTDLRNASPTGSPGEGVAALADVAATPLGLWLLRTVYVAPGADPAALADHARFPTPAALRAHLFDQLIPAVIATREPRKNSAEMFRPRRHHDPAQVRRWLGYLAHHLTGQPTPDSKGNRDFAWWRLAATTNAITWTTQLTITILTIVILDLALGLNGLLAVRHNGWFEVALWLVIGLAIGLAAGHEARIWGQGHPGYADLRIRQRWTELVHKIARQVAIGLAMGQVIGYVIGLALGLLGWGWLVHLVAGGLALGRVGRFVAGFAFGLAAGLAFGLGYGLMAGLTAWAETPAQVSHATTPMGSWRADRTLNLLRVSTYGLVGGLPLGLMFGLKGGLAGVPVLMVGLVLGLVAGLLFGDHRSWLAYLVATWRLARAGLLPRRLMPFLDDCHRLGLLRAVGPVYQFRHAELQDHLAATYRSTT
ncbi:NACHT domain-containing protein [Actinoallomurus vinaceus]|uniref:NACHT domain-containing protein n=1 Tax=Actinoallomurus vinaceus TaxID=1080074 RepID=A0ABP8UBA2_9ACTN